MTDYLKNFKIVFLIIVYIASYLFLGLVTEAEPFLVFLGTLPILLYVLAAVVLISREIEYITATIILSFLLPVLLYLSWLFQALPEFERMDGESLAVLQVIMLLAITGVLIIISKSRALVEEVKKIKDVDQKNENARLKSALKKYIDELNQKKEELQDLHLYKKQASDYKEELLNYEHKITELKQDIDKNEAVMDNIGKYKLLLKEYSKELQDINEELEQNKKYEKAAKKYAKENQAYAKKIKDLQKKLEEAKEEISINQNSFDSNLRGLEAKCKAINFTIGRVYADKKGGSSKIREKLHIPSELYNSFSQISTKEKEVDKDQLIDLIRAIQGKLRQLELQEFRLFTLNKPRLPVDRLENGKSRVIDVLEDNDKDPVREYYIEAKETCEKFIEYLKNEN